MTNFIRNLGDLGAAMRTRRRELGLTQEDLASRVGVTRQWVVEMEHGKPRAAIGLVLRTLDALGLDVLLNETVQPTVSAATDIDAVVNRARKRR